MKNSYFSLPKFFSVSDLQRNYSALLKNLRDSDHPLFILRKNDLEAVVLSPQLYQEFIEKIQLLEEQEALLAIKIYKKEKKEKRLKRMMNINELFSENGN
jgi:PHD/YefM family antitoxin component YafN of YafNO toxin-antitoxin module